MSYGRLLGRLIYNMIFAEHLPRKLEIYKARGIQQCSCYTLYSVGVLLFPLGYFQYLAADGCMSHASFCV